MLRRIAVALALTAFALCLVMGIMAENDIGTSIWRGLQAMFVTFFVALILGAMAERMLNENLSAYEKNAENSQSNSSASDR